MNVNAIHSRFLIALAALLLPACPAQTAAPPTTPTPRPETTTSVEPPPPPVDTAVYPLAEAVADALSGPLSYVATDSWFGLGRYFSCVYRNERVFVVNLYCAPREPPAFGVAILSPQRGRAYIYAEAKSPISKLQRGDYFTFKGDSSHAPEDPSLQLDLQFDFARLRAWDEKRYNAALPACYGGVEMGKEEAGCLRGLTQEKANWIAKNQSFFDQPPQAWYDLVRALRQRAPREGKPPASR